MLGKGLTVGIIVLFIASAIIPMTLGYNVKTKNNLLSIEKNNFNRYLYPEYYDCYNASEITGYGPIQDYKIETSHVNMDSERAANSEMSVQQSQPLNGPMDSPWPMYCHDTHHTGRSPYSTVDNYGDEIWRFKTGGWVGLSPVIDDNGTIYFGSDDFYALYPNGTLKWKYDTPMEIWCTPAIDENGVLYVGTIWAMPNYLYAIYKNNGSLKWKLQIGTMWSSPAIGDDGTIYCSTDGGEIGAIHAVYPNGTEKWRYITNDVVFSSPAIGLDGTIYCGSHDDNVYALYPNNGSLKWVFHTGSWVHGSPSIGNDGTIYVGSDDEYLYALCPNNGTMRWQLHVGAMYASPAIDENGVLYFGVWNGLFYAVYPNGTTKWSFDLGSQNGVWGSSAAISADGTIYFGMMYDIPEGEIGDIVALNSNGTLKWRANTGDTYSSPAIAVDGTVLIGSESGYIHAFNMGLLEANADGPHYGIINQTVQFTGSATGGYRPYSWLWNFGDGQTSTLQNPTHAYINPGNYTVTLTVTDNSGNTSSDTTWAKIKESNNPPTKPSISGETNGETGHMYYYTFVSTDPDNDEYLHYYIDWGDGENSGWKGPYAPGEDAGWGHYWDFWRTYTIKAKAIDNYGGESNWGTLSVTMPLNLQINQQSSNQLLLKMMQRLLLNAR